MLRRVSNWRGGLLLSAGVVALVLTACGGNAQPAFVTLPPPTDTPTPAPTLTPVPTVPVVAHNVTATPLPPDQLVSADNPPPTIPLAPTLTPAPETATVMFVPTPADLRVDYFTTDSELVSPGDNVTLFWKVTGADGARIFRQDDEGERIWRWDVRTSGQITVRVRPEDRDIARFLLEAWSGDVLIEQPLLIPLGCGEEWFFEPAPDGCPAGPPTVALEAEQVFERGRMIWVQELDRIYVIFEDGDTPRWAQYPDDFEEGDPERDESKVPPPGLLQPIRGFGLVWRNTPRVQERLGWGVTTEVPFDGMYQTDSVEPSVATLYLRMHGGGILALDAERDAWDVILFSEP